VPVARVSQDAGDELGVTPRDKLPTKIERTLERFVERGFIEEIESRIVGMEAYSFRSNAHHQVGLSLLPITTHERVHGVVWQWLVIQLDDRADEMLDRLALHAQGAGQSAHAARYLLRAAQKAGVRVEPDEERRLFEAAEALVSDDDVTTRLEISLGLGDALVRAADVEGSLERYDQALKLAWRMRSRSNGASALVRIGRVERDRGRLKEAEDYLLQAMRLFEAVEEQSGVAGICHDLGTVYWLRGDFDGALRLYRKADPIFRELDDQAGLAEIVHSIGVLHLEQGDLVGAATHLDDALELRRHLGDPTGLSATLNALGVVAASREEPEAAIAAWSEAMDSAERAGNRAWQAGVANNLAELLIPMERFDEARYYLEMSIERAERGERTRIVVDARRNLAMLHAVEGKHEEASAELKEARTAAKKLDQPRIIGAVDRSTGELAAICARAAEASGENARPHWVRAEAAWRKAATIFEKGDYALEAAITTGLLADALYELGKVKDAEVQRRRSVEFKSRHAIDEVEVS